MKLLGVNGVQTHSHFSSRGGNVHSKFFPKNVVRWEVSGGWLPALPPPLLGRLASRDYDLLFPSTLITFVYHTRHPSPVRRSLICSVCGSELWHRWSMDGTRRQREARGGGCR
eukprot:jgi/Botrbrau1/20006/Bobra.200_1s0013.1